MTAFYVTDRTTHMPTDTDVADAFRDATCAQVEAWLALDIDPIAGAAGAAEDVVTSSGIGGGSVSYGEAASARLDAVTQLSTEAADILSEAGLLHGHVMGV